MGGGGGGGKVPVNFYFFLFSIPRPSASFTTRADGNLEKDIYFTQNMNQFWKIFKVKKRKLGVGHKISAIFRKFDP